MALSNCFLGCLALIFSWLYLLHICSAEFAPHDVLILTVLIMQRSLTSSALLTKPMNAVSFVGGRVKMECSSNSSMPPVDWEFALAGSRDFSFIYTAGRITGSLSSRYTIDTDKITRYDVVINSVDFSHAGKYRCTPITEEVISASSYTAQLIVLASDPVCNTNASAMNNSIVEGDYIQMWCAVNYSGNWMPVMEYTGKDGEIVESNVLSTNTTTTVTSSLTKQLNSSDNGVTFTCKTSFKPLAAFIRPTGIRSGETPATNVPHYHRFWNFKTNVLYGPRNLTVQPKSFLYVVGDRLVCSADGNPSPTFQWRETGTNRVIHGPILIVDEIMALLQKLTIKCTATNILAGENKEISDFVTFVVAAIPTSSNAATVALTIVVVIVVITLIVLGFGVALTIKACTKGNSINPRSSNESSIQHQDREMAVEFNEQDGNSGHSIDPLRTNDSSTHHQDYERVDESNVQFEDSKPPSLHQTTSNEESTEDHSEYCDGYSSLHRDSSLTFAQPSVYTKLHLYANISFEET